MSQLIKTFLQDEQGQDLVEYALLLAFIALAAVAVLGNVSSGITAMFNKVNTTLTNAAATTP
jgi:pilus assembly protein Flp/PilA